MTCWSSPSPRSAKAPTPRGAGAADAGAECRAGRGPQGGAAGAGGHQHRQLLGAAALCAQGRANEVAGHGRVARRGQGLRRADTAGRPHSDPERGPVSATGCRARRATRCKPRSARRPSRAFAARPRPMPRPSVSAACTLRAVEVSTGEAFVPPMPRFRAACCRDGGCGAAAAGGSGQVQRHRHRQRLGADEVALRGAQR